MQIRKLILLLSIISLPACIMAQGVGVGTGTPNTSAVLDVSSTSKGLLPPRMSSEQRLAIVAPAAGLVVFDKDKNSLYLYNGQLWQALSAGEITQSNNYNYDKQLSDPAYATGDSSLFGYATTIWGEWAAVGAPYRRVNGVYHAGKVYLYHRSGIEWSLADSLAAPVSKPDGGFGEVIRMKGPYLLVQLAGYYASDETQRTGGVYIYFYNGSAWVLQTPVPIVPPGVSGSTSAHYYNFDIDSLGLTMVVGDNSTNIYTGAVYTYKRAGSTWPALPTATITRPGTSQTYSGFGSKVAMTNSRDFMAILSNRDTSYDSKTYKGCIDIFGRNVDAWSHVKRYFNPVSTAEVSDQIFGYALTFAEHPSGSYDYDLYVGLDLPLSNYPSRILRASKNAGGDWYDGDLSAAMTAFQKGLGQFDIYAYPLQLTGGITADVLIVPSTERANMRFVDFGFPGADPYIDFAPPNYSLGVSVFGNIFSSWDNYFVIGRAAAGGNFTGDVIFGRYNK